MASGLRNRAGFAISVALLLIQAIPAAGEAYAACWVEERTDPINGRTRQFTVCRVADGETTEFPGDEPPTDLNPSVGNDATGECWFWTSAETDWVILSAFADGTAILGSYFETVLILDTGRIPRCTSDPDVGDPPEETAWEAITEYVHDPPEPDLSPPAGRGLTGMDTHLAVPVPGAWSDTISIPLYTIDVEVRVDAVEVDWGDGSVTTYSPQQYEDLTGYPDGVARHVYEVKTCDPPGRDPDCHPEHSAYQVQVSYLWGARWRSNGGAWTEVDVPPSSTSVAYPVIEAVSTLTDVR